MNLTNIHTVYFLGIGGIGMSALARYFNAQGKLVCGYDKTPTALTAELQKEGIKVNFSDDIKFFQSEIRNPKPEILIVYTPAIPKDHKEFNWFQDNGYELMKRATVLGLITKQSYTIGVAGTHGKTTTSSIVAHLLKSAGFNITAFLGGITKNYNTNLILSGSGSGLQASVRVNSEERIVNNGSADNRMTNDQGPTDNEIVVIEADEYDRSFLTLYPDMAVITSMDADHLDIYGSKEYMDESYQLFAKQVKPQGKLFAKKGLNTGSNPITYSINEKADYYAENIRIENHEYVYDLVSPVQSLKGLTLGLPGIHNVENSVAAVAMVQQLGINGETIRKALKSYSGVKRRFEYHIKSKDLTYIDDYAHHPEELRACITSIKDLYPNKKICGIFQPHLFSRTRDFADGFAESLSLLDELIMLDIYPARELPIEGVTSQMILDKMAMKNASLCSKANLLNEVSKRNFDVLVTVGAGDIDTFVQPITEMLSQKVNKQHHD
jgi:UDP-N-acetylmuramate--alanine ligase